MLKTIIIKIVIKILFYKFSDLTFIKISYLNIYRMIEISFCIFYIAENNIGFVIHTFQL